MMYFDLGSAGWFRPGVKDGRPWRMHEILFIADYNKTVVRNYCQPGDIKVKTGEQVQQEVDAGGVGGSITLTEWDNPEWSNHPYFAAAAITTDRLWNFGSGWQHKERNEFIYAVNLKDSTYLQLIDGGDTTFTSEQYLQWPWLWVKVDSSFEEDPAWLNPRLGAKPFARRNAFRQSGLWIDKGKIVSSQPLRCISLYDLQGRLIVQRQFSTAVCSVDMSEFVRQGMLLISARDARGASAQFRHSSIH
jgi:hypothetical protein